MTCTRIPGGHICNLSEGKGEWATDFRISGRLDGIDGWHHFIIYSFVNLIAGIASDATDIKLWKYLKYIL